MLTYLKGTVFNAPAKTLVNTVNCSGVMGAGIALEFKLRFPEMFEDYVKKCESKQIKIGVPHIYEYSEKLWIMNFPTKIHWRFPSKLEWIEQGLKYFAENFEKRNIESIAFPKLGTNNGGLDWNEVKLLMERYLKDVNLPIYICLDELNEAEGIEKIMVDGLNNSTIEELIKEVKLSKKQAENVINHLPITRFFYIFKQGGIGEKTYEKLFRYFYTRANIISNQKNVGKVTNEEKYEQLSFF
jgi:O-acetyl-ADP-ribose deacetylase (regulator of RNase III)